MHSSRSVPLLSGILACVAVDEHGRARTPARSHAFCDAFIQTNASTQGNDSTTTAQGHYNAAAQRHINDDAQGHSNAAAQSHINHDAQGHGNSRFGCVACRAATGFTSGLSSADEDRSGIYGDH